ncbi:DUF1801 domain-containing protein [Sphingomonas alpina]|nr:DUF1801 domain-containing protein [Sphingomonas alpina]
MPDPVARVFAGYPADARAALMTIRDLIFAVAAETDAVGALTETLKWGEPAYLTEASGSGSTIRIAWKPAVPDRYALYFNCKTSLVDTFRSMFETLSFEGDRAITLGIGDAVPETELSACIRLALTYHRRAGRDG